MTQFYVTLPSNSSYYGQQPMNNYKTKLANPLTINREEWEVGLSEIIYPYTWNNLQRNAEITIGVSNLHTMPKNYILKEKTLTFRISHYSDAEALVAKINHRIENALYKMKKENPIIAPQYWRLRFKYSHHSGKIYLLGNNHLYIKLSSNLASMLGFGNKEVVLGSAILCPQIEAEYKKTFKEADDDTDEAIEDTDDDNNNDATDVEDFKKQLKSDVMADVHEGLTCLYVYSPIVESQYVGDMKAPLLRVIPVHGRFGHTQTV